MFVVSAQLWIYGSGSAGDKFLSNIKKETKKKGKWERNLQREKWPKSSVLFFFLWRLHSLWNRSRRTREYIRKEDCTKSWVIIHNKQTAVERKIRRRSSTPKRTTKMRCGIAHTTHNKKRLGRWTRTWESVSSLHSTSTDIKTCSLFTTTNYHSVFLPLNWNERKNNIRTKNVSGIPSWKRIAFWGTLFWSIKKRERQTKNKKIRKGRLSAIFTFLVCKRIGGCCGGACATNPISIDRVFELKE